MVVGAEERVQALRSMQHVVVGATRALIVLVVFARPRQGGELGIKFVVVRRRTRRCGAVGGVERERWRTGERRAHQHHGAEHVRPDQRAPGRDRRAGIVPHHGRNRAVAEREHEPHRIAHHVERTERIGIGIVGIVPSRGAPVTALVGRDHVVAGRGQRRHHLTPAVGELRKTVQQQHDRPVASLVARFQDMHGEAVHPRHHAGTDAGRQRAVAVRSEARGVRVHDGRRRRARRHRHCAGSHRRRGRDEAPSRQLGYARVGRLRLLRHAHTSLLFLL